MAMPFKVLTSEDDNLYIKPVVSVTLQSFPHSSEIHNRLDELVRLVYTHPDKLHRSGMQNG